jgi:hypothetical protein
LQGFAGIITGGEQAKWSKDMVGPWGLEPRPLRCQGSKTQQLTNIPLVNKVLRQLTFAGKVREFARFDKLCGNCAGIVREQNFGAAGLALPHSTAQFDKLSNKFDFKEDVMVQTLSESRAEIQALSRGNAVPVKRNSRARTDARKSSQGNLSNPALLAQPSTADINTDLGSACTDAVHSTPSGGVAARRAKAVNPPASPVRYRPSGSPFPQDPGNRRRAEASLGTGAGTRAGRVHERRRRLISWPWMQKL